MPRPNRPMRIALSEDRRRDLVSAVQRFAADEFDVAFSGFQAEGLLDFFVRHLGPTVYNQAIQDARAFLHDRLTDLEGEFYEPEESRP